MPHATSLQVLQTATVPTAEVMASWPLQRLELMNPSVSLLNDFLPTLQLNSTLQHLTLSRVNNQIPLNLSDLVYLQYLQALTLEHCHVESLVQLGCSS